MCDKWNILLCALCLKLWRRKHKCSSLFCGQVGKWDVTWRKWKFMQISEGDAECSVRLKKEEVYYETEMLGLFMIQRNITINNHQLAINLNMKLMNNQPVTTLLSKKQFLLWSVRVFCGLQEQWVGMMKRRQKCRQELWARTGRHGQMAWDGGWENSALTCWFWSELVPVGSAHGQEPISQVQVEALLRCYTADHLNIKTARSTRWGQDQTLRIIPTKDISYGT